MAWFRAQVFAETTRKTYATHLKTYLKFCEMAELQPVPISSKNLACYAAHLASKLSYNSMRQYLNIVRILHEDANLPNPFQDNWLFTSLFKGIRRALGSACKPKLPITVPLLRQMYHKLDFSLPRDVVFWAACLIAFFSFLRKSHLFPGKVTGKHSLPRGW